MLKVNKPLMDQAFEKLCLKGSAQAPDSGGTIYKAAYHAYYDKSAEKLPKSDPTDQDIMPVLTATNATAAQIKLQLQNDAHEFASLFADSMNDILKEVSNQIDAHVQAIADGIIITMLPQGIATIVSPVGPCSGSMVIQNNSTAQIEII
jgi:hypothetical protein